MKILLFLLAALLPVTLTQVALGEVLPTKKERCAQLIEKLSGVVQVTTLNALSQVGANRELKMKVFVLPVPSKHSTKVVPDTMLSVLNDNKVRITQINSYGPNSTLLTLKAPAKNFINFFSRLSDLGSRLQISALVRVAFLDTPLYSVNVRDLDQVRDAQERLLYSGLLDFSGFQGAGIGKTDDRYTIVVIVASEKSVPTESPRSFDGVEVEYRVQELPRPQN
jgi:hypothetical protein